MARRSLVVELQKLAAQRHLARVALAEAAERGRGVWCSGWKSLGASMAQSKRGGMTHGTVLQLVP